jgi:DNA topoisomerase-3
MKTSSFSNSNPIWTFDYRVEGADCEMVFTSVLGHLQTFALPDELESNWAVDPIVLFDCPLTKKTAEAGLPIEKTLKAEARKATWLILWLDCEYVL